MSFYDANDALNEVARYMGIENWLTRDDWYPPGTQV
jgi:hypothetical protein